MSVKKRIDRYLAYNRSRILKAVQSNEEKAVFFFNMSFGNFFCFFEIFATIKWKFINPYSPQIISIEDL